METTGYEYCNREMEARQLRSTAETSLRAGPTTELSAAPAKRASNQYTRDVLWCGVNTRNDCEDLVVRHLLEGIAKASEWGILCAVHCVSAIGTDQYCYLTKSPYDHSIFHTW